MTIQRVARQGDAEARTGEHRTGGPVRRVWPATDGLGFSGRLAGGRSLGLPKRGRVTRPAGPPPLTDRLPRRIVSHVEALDVEPEPGPRSRPLRREQGRAVP